RDTASRPSEASATTCMSGSRSISSRKPVRTTAWSSASTTLMLMDDLLCRCHRQLNLDARPAARLGMRLEPPAEVSHSFLHAQDSEPARRTRLEAFAIIGNGE